MASSSASSSARPHRHARSGVSYRDPYYDYEDNFSLCRRSGSSCSPVIANRGKDRKYAAKEDLALKPAKNRANAKERAEAAQLRIAINESLSHERYSETNVHLRRAAHESLPENRAANVAQPVFTHEKSVVESMDEHTLKTLSSDEIIPMNCLDETACNDCLAFQCLLDVATEAVEESALLAGKSKDSKQTHFTKQSEKNWDLEPLVTTLEVEMPQNKSTSGEMDELGKCEDSFQDKAKDQTTVRDEGKGDYSDGLDEGGKEQVDTENETSDLSDESGCQLRRPVRLQQNALQNTAKDNVIPVQVKKSKSASRALLKLKVMSSENCQTLVPTPCKLLVKAPGGNKENILTSTSMEVTKNTVSTWKEQRAAENGTASKSNPDAGNSKSWEMQRPQQGFTLSSAEQQGNWSAPLQPPALLHRRVLGLSRRHRPPPLHPYLVNRDW